MAIAVGIGKFSQDWSYLTATRGLHVQDANITDPALIDDQFIIDTTSKLTGEKGDRGRNQTLVIYASVFDSAAMLSNAARLSLWIDSAYSDTICGNTGPNFGSSSSNFGCPDYPTNAALGSTNRWALIDVASLTNAPGTTNSLCFYWPWLPAGKYKAAISVGITSGRVLISEQHTE